MKLVYCYLLMIAFYSSNSWAELRRVIDKDRPDIGIECDIKIVTEDGTEKYVSYTDDDGYIQADINCENLHKIFIVPKGDYFTETIRCPITQQQIKLSSIKTAESLASKAYFHYQKGEYGAAALAYNDASFRYVGHDEELSKKYALESFKSTAKELGVAKAYVFDPNQGKQVISPELGVAIGEFQASVGLQKQGGVLDFKTLNKISSKSLTSIMKGPNI